MNQFGMFAKFWEPGRVKTRLAKTIGNESAARFHELSVRVLLERFSSSADRHVLSVAPATRIPEFQDVAGANWTVEAQPNGDLGARMREYFANAFAHGANRVLLIGSDSPTMPDSVIEMAFDKLGSYDTVVAPSEDGGYYLIGATQKVPPVFEQVDWSSPQVWEQTVTLLKRHHSKWCELPTWYDVDDFDDLLRIKRELDDVETYESVTWNDLRHFAGPFAREGNS